MDRVEKQKNPILETTKNNPWYTSDQIDIAQRHQRRTIERRYCFILQCVEAYLQCPHKKPIRILDAGCGDGVLLQGFIPFPGLEVWGTDYNLLRASRAKRNFPTSHIVCEDILYPSYRSASFDIVLCSQLIEHIPQDDLLLEKLAEVLKPQGLMILGTPNEGCFLAHLRNHILERNIMKNTDHIHFYKEAVIRRKIETAGFIIQEVMRENWFFPHQRINYYLTNRRWGFRFMAQLNKILPSQAAGYYFKCVKSL